MTDRDRLIKLFNAIEKDPAVTCPHYKTDKTCDTCKYTINNFMCNHTERTVDYLLANGVIVPPCKVGDTVYVIVETSCEDIDLVHTVCEFYNEKHEDLCTLSKGKCPYKYIVNKYSVDQMNILHFSANFGKTVFLTKEEAEQALAERRCNNA